MRPRAIVFDMYGVVYGHTFNVELIEVIRQLKQSYKVGLLSNISRDRLDGLLEEGGITGLFDVALASSETAYVKPRPELFERICEMLDVEPQEAVFIDDSADNVAGAEAMGMRAHQFYGNEALFDWLAEQGISIFRQNTNE